MNEIEAAIEYLEDTIPKMERALPGDESIPQLKFTLSALREKAERSNPKPTTTASATKANARRCKMDRSELIQYNEALAIRKIQIVYINDGLLEAMKLCQTYMGLSTPEAYAKVKEMMHIE